MKSLGYSSKFAHIFLMSGLFCVSFFGALAAIFLLISALIYLLPNRSISDYVQAPFKDKIVAYFLISGVWWLYLISGLINNNEYGLYQIFLKLSSSISIPLVGLILLSVNKIKLNKFIIANTSVYSIITILFLVLILQLSPESSIFYEYSLNATSRLELFSGNPIPFSTAVICLSFIALFNSYSDSKIRRVSSIFTFLLGFFIASFLSGTRGSLAVLIISSPIIFVYLYKSKITLFELLAATLPFAASVIVIFLNLDFNDFIDKIASGITYIFGSGSELSSQTRFEIWKAAFSAIRVEPVWGHGIVERFTAIRPYLSENYPHLWHSHSHNDLISSMVIAGLLGGILSFASLSSPVLYIIYKKVSDKHSQYIAITLTILNLVIGTTNTMTFNETSSTILVLTLLLTIIITREKKIHS